MSAFRAATSRAAALREAGFKKAAPFALNAGLRLTAMGGKFLFLLIAATSMEEDDFGRIGIVLATALILVAVVGLEGYQTLIRDIVQSDAEKQRGVRGFYVRFAVMSAVLSGVLAVAIFSAYGWPLPLVLLAAAVVACEHLNIEVGRMLVTEGRATLSIVATAARTGVWALALPIVSAVGIISFDWDEYLVLGAWLSCSIAGMLCAVPIRRLYLGIHMGFPDFRGMYRRLLKASGIWVVITASWRVLENGGRLIVGVFLGEAASGRFTLLSTIGSFALVSAKGVLEPMYFPRLIGDDAERELQRFATALKWLIAASALGSFVLAAIYSAIGESISSSEWVVLASVVVASSALTFSQIPHFALYRHGRDRVILRCNLTAGIVGLLAACALTAAEGMVGCGLGIAVGALVLWATKQTAWRRELSAPDATSASGRVAAEPLEAP